MKRILYILFFINCSLLTFNCYSQWVQQTLPQSGTPYDMKFVNANTGWLTFYNPGMLFKTTNAGTNWFTQTTPATDLYDIKFFNDTMGYILGYAGGNKLILKTTNGGTNWNTIYISPNAFISMSFVNPDTGWIGGFDGMNSLIYRTTNGGLTFQNQFTQFENGIDKIFFLNQIQPTGYYGWASAGNIFRKTTNSGVNWFVAAPITASNKIYFINKDTGWVCTGNMYKTINGGTNWINEPMPTGGLILDNAMQNFTVLGRDILYGTGGDLFYPNGRVFGIIWKSTNGGLNWGYQLPDTNTVKIGVYKPIYFVDSITGWAYNNDLSNKGAHTTNGGGQINYTGINIISTEIPKDFQLFQNYPNPFNPTTNIKYQIVKSKYVLLKVYDVIGKEIITLVNQKQNAGTYEVSWDANNYTSGIYFYTLMVDGNIINTKKMILIK